MLQSQLQDKVNDENEGRINGMDVMDAKEGKGGKDEINESGKLYIIGIGPGSVEHMTVRAINAIRESEYVLGNDTYMDQISELLEGKEIVRSCMGKEVDRAQKAVELSCDHVTSIISGGDANVYGMAGIVLEVAERMGYSGDIEVVPGVSALNAVGSVLGAPIVSDFAAISLSDLLTPWEVIEKRLRMAADADFVMAIYNPKSRGRKSNFARAVDIIKDHKDGSTPVGIVKNCMREGQSTIVTTFDRILEYEDDIDMRTTIMIGNGESRIWEQDGMSRIITPRGYHKKYDY